MRSLLGPLFGPLFNQAPPVPLAAKRSSSGAMLGASGTAMGFEAQLRSYTSNGTVNGIVSRTSTAVSQVEWHLYRKAKSGKKEDRVAFGRSGATALASRAAEPAPVTIDAATLDGIVKALEEIK